LENKNFTIGQGILEGSPIAMAYLPVGFALGVVAGQLGFSFFENFLFFAACLSGSGQSIAVNMLGVAQPVAAIVTTAAVINLRYFLMSAALTPYLTHWRRRDRYFLSLFVTDETFALHASHFKHGVPPKPYVFAINFTAWGAWTLGGVLGYLAGGYVADVRPFGFDFAVPGMFIALVVIQLENARLVALAILAGALAVLLSLTPFKGWAVILAGMICATLGSVWEQWKKE
jgi:4-azaleucine resistance transporter AzlC